MMALTCLRRLGALDLMIAQCLDRPPPPKARAAMDLTRLGLTQILYMDIPDHAAVDETVSLAQSIGAGPYKSMINAILRRATRERDSLLDLAAQPGACLPPGFSALAENLRVATGRGDRRGLAETRAPGYFGQGGPPNVEPTIGRKDSAHRIPSPKGDRQRHRSRGIRRRRMVGSGRGRRHPAKTFRRPAGQDRHRPLRGSRRKNGLARRARAKVVAVDRSESRMKRLRENMDRLGLDVESDIVDGGDFVRGEKVDGVLVDAPCSATGTLRRHPDAAWLKNLETLKGSFGHRPV